MKLRCMFVQYLQLGLEPGPDGDTLEIARRSTQDEKAVVKIQARDQSLYYVKDVSYV